MRVIQVPYNHQRPRRQVSTIYCIIIESFPNKNLHLFTKSVVSTACTSASRKLQLNLLQKKQKRRPRTASQHTVTVLPYEWPGKQSQSQYRNGPSIGFAESTHEQYEKINHPKTTSR